MQLKKGESRRFAHAGGGGAPRLARVLQNHPNTPPSPQTAVRLRADLRTISLSNGFEQGLYFQCTPARQTPRTRQRSDQGCNQQPLLRGGAGADNGVCGGGVNPHLFYEKSEMPYLKYSKTQSIVADV